ncbi:MAG: hypothetical protein QME66_03070 [Candidatus Eisenbacteria bacterium]|nr:hypothetical protein [Candidatus Eisenbacteria bacterium]
MSKKTGREGLKLPVLERLERLDRRYIFIAIFIAVIVPLIFPIWLPVRVSPEVQGLYDSVEKLPPGSVVYFAADFDPGSMAELRPMMISTLRHLFRRDIKVIGACLWPAGPPLLEEGFGIVAEGEYGKKYGIDFVNLGFKEGREAVMVQLGKSFHSVYPADYYGKPVSEIPIMKNAYNFDNTAMIVNISAGYPGTKEWIQQVKSRFHITIGAGCTAVSAPEFYPYVQSGQLVGLMGGLAGAAEYEKLIGNPADATKGMDAQSLGHVVILIFVILGNIIYFAGGGSKKTGRVKAS